MSRADLLTVDLGFRAGIPPARPKVTPASRASAAAEADAARTRDELVAVERLRAVLAGGLVSLEAGARPGQVARRVAVAVGEVAA